MSKDYYAILGVSRSADSATIHSAFRALARQYHPDAGRGSSISKFREALEAYHTLSDPARRRQHDIDLREPMTSGKIPAEPLFAPARAPMRPAAYASIRLNEVMSFLLNSFESEIDFPFFSGELF